MKFGITHISPLALDKRRKAVEAWATVGLLLIAAGLVAPFVASESLTYALVFRIIFSVGAVTYLIARSVPVNAEKDSRRLRSLRRMEFWAGVAFLIGAALWWWNASRYPYTPYVLAVLRDTVAFTLAGAIVQIIASWMISSRMRREAVDDAPASGSTDKSRKQSHR